MIGIDRPLRPEWIYDTLRMIEVGKKPSIYNDPFEKIAEELLGKEGKRKVRTIIFRSFIYSFQKGKTAIKRNYFIDWAENDTPDHLKPLFLMKILMDYEIARFVVQKMMISTDSSNRLSVSLLSKHMVKAFGDRDVVKRSLRSFLATLVHFGILRKSDQKNFILNEKQPLSHEQVKKFILLYSKAFVRSKVINLKEIETEFLYFFQPVDLIAVAVEFNGSCWEYVREIERDMLILKNDVAAG
ncbi:MAG: hypothetical protein GY749_35405 [Desulfobacteraceae bacterium]|nr:hypothetical protein [Desulfobacteraceae bacterium]